jgi:hypothetical protein
MKEICEMWVSSRLPLKIMFSREIWRGNIPPMGENLEVEVEVEITGA